VATSQRQNQRIGECVTSKYGAHDQLNADHIFYGKRHVSLDMFGRRIKGATIERKIGAMDPYCLPVTLSGLP